MKLYYSPGSCSLAPHIVLREAQLPFELVRVSLRKGQTESGVDYKTINPRGAVPALQLDDGSLLTEGPAIMQYVADQRPESGLAPPFGTMARYRLLEWMSLISFDLQRTFGPLFRAATPDETKQALRDMIGCSLSYITTRLDGHEYLLGASFTVADAYLFTILRWADLVQLSLEPWPLLRQLAARVAARPAVRAALEAEGLLKQP